MSEFFPHYASHVYYADSDRHIPDSSGWYIGFDINGIAWVVEVDEIGVVCLRFYDAKIVERIIRGMASEGIVSYDTLVYADDDELRYLVCKHLPW